MLRRRWRYDVGVKKHDDSSERLGMIPEGKSATSEPFFQLSTVLKNRGESAEGCGRGADGAEDHSQVAVPVHRNAGH